MDFVKRHRLFICLAAGVLAADQALKWIIVKHIPLYHKVEVIPGFFNIVHYRNPGGAFGMFASSGGILLALAFLVITIAAMALILYLYACTPREKPFFSSALALVFGGAAGNLADRLRFGNVVDFIDVYVGEHHWPAFNLADSAITIGMVIFAGYVIFKKAPQF